MASTTLRAGLQPLREPASFPGAFAYERTDIPPGMSASAYRRACAARRSAVEPVTHRALRAFIAWARSER